MTYDKIIEKVYELIKIMINSAPLLEEEIYEELSVFGSWSKIKDLKNDWQISYNYESVYISNNDIRLSINLKYKNISLMEIILWDNESTFALFFGSRAKELNLPEDMSLVEYTLTYNRIDDHLIKVNSFVIINIDSLMSEIPND